jgi:hypothetical protein
MVITPTLASSATSEVDSTLSEPPATAVLNRIEQEIGLSRDFLDIDEIDLTSTPTLEETPREPRQHKATNGTLYIEVLVKKDKGKSRSAWYWQHGAEFEIQNPKEGTIPRVWRCNHCKGFQSYGVNSSSHIRDHLKTYKLQEGKTSNQGMSIVERLQNHTPAAVDSRPLAEADRKAIQTRKFEAALVAFLCCVHVAFNIVENEFFVALLATLSNIAGTLLPDTHNTARAWAIKSYEKRKLQVQQLLQKARSNIHLSFDLWTSNNHYAFNAIVAHFVTSDYTVASVLLAFRNILGPHSGENIAASVDEVVQEYGFQSRLGCFILDNATTNDTAVEVLGKIYKWGKNEHKQRRLRCMGHIVNLVAQAFILGEKQEMFEQALVKAERGEDNQDEAIKFWQLCGPIGKLHYTVVFILRTPQRRHAFKRGSDEHDATTLVPKRDNSTRWNSIYQMIKRALKLHAQINLFCSYTYKDDFNDAMRLNDEDWYILVHLAAALLHFESATMALQSQATNAEFGAMAEAIPVIEALSNELTDLQLRFPLNTTFECTEIDTLTEEIDTLPALLDTLDTLPPRTDDDPASGFITECTNRAHTKLSDYYGLTDESTWFIAGMILNPTVKWKWCKRNWKDKPEWLLQAQGNMRRLWQSYRPTQAAQISSSHKRQLPNRGLQSKKSVRREGNYRDSTLYGCLDEDSDDEEVTPVDEYEACYFGYTTQELLCETHGPNGGHRQRTSAGLQDPGWPKLTLARSHTLFTCFEPPGFAQTKLTFAW